MSVADEAYRHWERQATHITPDENTKAAFMAGAEWALEQVRDWLLAVAPRETKD